MTAPGPFAPNRAGAELLAGAWAGAGARAGARAISQASGHSAHRKQVSLAYCLQLSSAVTNWLLLTQLLAGYALTSGFTVRVCGGDKVHAITLEYLQMEPLKRGVLGGTPEVAVAQHLGWCRCPVLLCSASVSLPPTDTHTLVHTVGFLYAYAVRMHNIRACTYLRQVCAAAHWHEPARYISS